MHREEIFHIRQNPTFQKLDKEIREQRQAEAIKKAISKKAAAVARYLGSEIRAPGFGLDDVGFTQDIYDLDVYDTPEEGILEVSEDSFGLIGWSFDALNHGCNIQVTLMTEEYRVCVFHNGILVFDEVAGDLERYLPSSEWEDRIEHWHKKTEKMKKQAKLAEEQDRQWLSTKLLHDIRELLKLTWGV